MLEPISNLLTHYANRINVSVSGHPKGIQVSIAIMPCPLKIKDETMRQQLIQPIVVAGDTKSVMEQLSGLDETINEALSNEDIDTSVRSFNQSVNNAKATQKTQTTATPKAVEKLKVVSGDSANQKPQTASTEPTNPLSDFLA